MYFDFSAEQQTLRQETRALLESDSPISLTRRLFDDLVGYDPEVWKEGASSGWYGMLTSDRFGGDHLTDQPLVDLVVVAEEHGRMLQPGPFRAVNTVAFAIDQCGTEEQRRQYLPELAAGDVIASWAIAEENSYWDPSTLAITAERHGEDYVLHGTKILVEHASASDFLLVTARCQTGLVQLLVPIATRGVTVSPRISLDLTNRLYGVRFNAVCVPRSAALGTDQNPPATARHVDKQLQVAKVLQCAESAAGARRLIELCIDYGKQRIQFGAPIGAFQAIKHKIANMHIAAETATVAAHYAALAVANDLADAANAVDVAKIVANDVYASVASEAIQVHGGAGFRWDSDIHLHLRRAKSNQVLYGDADAHREHLCRTLQMHLPPASERTA